MAGTQVKHMNENTPVQRFAAGQVVAAVWENEITLKGRTVTVLKATISRRYRDTSGQWKSTGSFGRNEIPLAIHCLQQAFEFILAEEQARKAGQEGSTP